MMTSTSEHEKPSGEQTRERLLYAAGEVFAEQGFRSATVREICRRANVNIASVNYHFSSKEELYAAILVFAFGQAEQKYALTVTDPKDTPVERLSRFVLKFMMGLLDEGRPAYFGKLMAREIVEPTGALHRIIDNAFLPLHRSLGTILRDIVGDIVSEDDIHRSVLSILGQCLFYRHADPVIRRLYPRFLDDDDCIECAAAHITAFSLAGLKALGKTKETTRP